MQTPTGRPRPATGNRVAPHTRGHGMRRVRPPRATPAARAGGRQVHRTRNGRLSENTIQLAQRHFVPRRRRRPHPLRGAGWGSAPRNAPDPIPARVRKWVIVMANHLHVCTNPSGVPNLTCFYSLLSILQDSKQNGCAARTRPACSPLLLGRGALNSAGADGGILSMRRWSWCCGRRSHTVFCRAYRGRRLAGQVLLGRRHCRGATNTPSPRQAPRGAWRSTRNETPGLVGGRSSSCCGCGRAPRGYSAAASDGGRARVGGRPIAAVDGSRRPWLGGMGAWGSAW